MKGVTQMTVIEAKERAKLEKRNLINMILTFQSNSNPGHIYTMEELETKTLSRLQEIYDSVMRK